MATASPVVVVSARRSRWRRVLRGTTILTGGLWLALALGCGDPCRRLAEDVCKCAVSRAEEQRCLRHVRSLAGQNSVPISSAGRERCAALEASCTCEALAAGDLSACGLTELAP